MADSSPASWRHPLVLRSAAWYAVVGGAAIWWQHRMPELWSGLPPGALTGALRDAVAGGPGAMGGIGSVGAVPSAIPTALAMATAVAAALPVAWTYSLTRRKKGFQQSVAQTYLILPLVVAGIVVLVKTSLALAFALGGIVAAVRFRVALDDSKDAAGIFVATGIGMAAAVEPDVAWVISVGFNVLMMALWTTDFGRPAALEGREATKRLDKAMATVNRTGMFVARLDDEVLKSMAPAQLDALADRAWRRRKRAEVDLLADADAAAESDENGARWTHLLRVRVAADDHELVREAIEPHAGTYFARFRYLGAPREGEERVLEFGVVLREETDLDRLPAQLREVGGTRVRTLELR